MADVLILSKCNRVTLAGALDPRLGNIAEDTLDVNIVVVNTHIHIVLESGAVVTVGLEGIDLSLNTCGEFNEHIVGLCGGGIDTAVVGISSPLLAVGIDGAKHNIGRSAYQTNLVTVDAELHIMSTIAHFKLLVVVVIVEHCQRDNISNLVIIGHILAHGHGNGRAVIAQCALDPRVDFEL